MFNLFVFENQNGSRKKLINVVYRKLVMKCILELGGFFDNWYSCTIGVAVCGVNEGKLLYSEKMRK